MDPGGKRESEMMFCLIKFFTMGFSLTLEEKALARSFILALTQSRRADWVDGKENLAIESAMAWVAELSEDDLRRSKQR